MTKSIGSMPVGGMPAIAIIWRRTVSRPFHLVVKRFCLDEHALGGEKTNKLVLIGRNLDRAQLRYRLEACLAPIPSSAESRPHELPHRSTEVKDQYGCTGVDLGARRF